jgi:hypothetical protein
VVGLHTRDAARALPLHLQILRSALAVFLDKHVASNLKVRRLHVRLVVVLLNRSFVIASRFLATCAWIFVIAFDSFSISVSFCALIKSRGALTGTLFFNISANGVVSACPVKTFMVLCADRDETSVDIMCRRFCCNFLRKSRL